MLSNATNPYNHLRNQILIPFKNQTNKLYFLKEFMHYLTNYEIRSYETYKGILLTVILLFAEVIIQIFRLKEIKIS